MHSNVFWKICMGLFIFAIWLVSQTLAQTVLNPGDISFITVNSSPDYFEIISTKDISTWTTLFFADNAWSWGVRRTTEWSLSVITNQTIAAGTIIQFSWVDTSSPILSPAIWSITRNWSFDLSSNWDQILVYQGIDPLDISASFIYGLWFWITNSWISSWTPTSNTSYLPWALVIGSSAINNSAKNIQYNCHNVWIYSTTFLSDINDLTYRNGSTSAYSPSLCIFDTIQPQSTINLASWQQTITSTMNIKFSIEFSEPINISSLECSDILFAWTAWWITCVSINEIAPNNWTTFEINTSVTSDWTIIANLNTGSVNDVAWNPHVVSNIINNSVTVNSALPVITISWSTDITIAQNSLYNDEGATWTDTLDWNWILILPTSWAVDASNLWTYILEYSYINTAWNTGTNIRTVHVTDQTPPQINWFW